MARPRPLIGITTYPSSQAGRSGLPHEYVTRQRRFDALVAACDRPPTRTRGGNP